MTDKQKPSFDAEIVLASGSPRRQQLMQQYGYHFQVVAPRDTAECGICSRESPPEMVCRLARQKAEDVALRFDNGLFLGADTVADCMGLILGKPSNCQHAKEMLQLMRGRVHHVYSGICLWRRPDNWHSVRVATTKLKMDEISDEKLENYLASGLWEGKAGAFGYQDELDWVHVLAGSESNVVGLPMELLEEMLQQVDS